MSTQKYVTGQGQGGIFLKSYGNSMWPLIREGDIILGVEALPEEIEKGDLVIFRRQSPESTVCHRLFKKTGSGGQAVLFTRGDTVFGRGEEFSAEALLGKAQAVARGGRIEELSFKDASLSRRSGIIFCRAISFLAGFFKPLAAGTLRILQGRHLYRRIAAALFARKFKYETVEGGKIIDLPPYFYQRMILAPAGRRMAQAIARKGGRIVAAAELSLPEDSGACLLHSCYVRLFYRGAGIAGSLSRSLIEYARDNGLPAVVVSVREKNYPAIRLFRKLGFSQGGQEAIRFEAEGYLIMKKGLN